MIYRHRDSTHPTSLRSATCLAAARSRSGENNTQLFSKTLAPLRYSQEKANKFHALVAQWRCSDKIIINCRDACPYNKKCALTVGEGSPLPKKNEI